MRVVVLKKRQFLGFCLKRGIAQKRQVMGPPGALLEQVIRAAPFQYFAVLLGVK